MSKSATPPTIQDLTSMAWEVKAVLDALDELLPATGSREWPVDLHSLIWLASARARELANHLSEVVEVTRA